MSKKKKPANIVILDLLESFIAELHDDSNCFASGSIMRERRGSINILEECLTKIDWSKDERDTIIKKLNEMKTKYSKGATDLNEEFFSQISN